MMIGQLIPYKRIVTWLAGIAVLLAVTNIVLTSIAVNLMLLSMHLFRTYIKSGIGINTICNQPSHKYLRSGLNEELKKSYTKRLEETIQKNQSYLNASITLADLSEESGIPQNYLSQIINETYRKNFYDYMNGFRIKRAKVLLSDPSKANMSILDILYDVGFNSKSTFYTAFSKETGLTPRKFRIKQIGTGRVDCRPKIVKHSQGPNTV